MNDAITIITMQCCNDFPSTPVYKIHRGSVRLLRIKAHLGCRPPSLKNIFNLPMQNQNFASLCVLMKKTGFLKQGPWPPLGVTSSGLD